LKIIISGCSNSAAASPVITTLEQQGLTLVAILVTHSHHDHVGGIAELVRRYHPAVYGPRNEIIPFITHPLGNGDQVSIGLLQLAALDVPGHTVGHIAYYGHDNLFCGDTLFTAGCGKIFSGTLHQLHQSLLKIASLPKNTNIYCAHEYTLENLRFALIAEPDNAALKLRQQQAQTLRQQGLATVPSTLELELNTNPFLRCHSTTIITVMQQKSANSLKDEEDIFRALRQLRDDFT
jgi:hydroxyacylglutathione hydrolase